MHNEERRSWRNPVFPTFKPEYACTYDIVLDGGLLATRYYIALYCLTELLRIKRLQKISSEQLEMNQVKKLQEMHWNK